MLTKMTKGLFAGQHINSIERDMSDHRRLAPRKRDRNNTAKPPRTRDGQTYPGGKHMRKVLAKLGKRQANSPQEGNKPGSMKSTQGVC